MKAFKRPTLRKDRKVQYIESDTLIFVSVVALVGWIIWLQFQTRRQQMELKQMQLKLSSSALEKFGDADKFLAFLESREGQAILCDGESPRRSRDRTNIRVVQFGTLLLFIGAGLFLCAARYHGAQGQDLQDVLAVLNLTGTVAVSSGVGLYAVAIVAMLWERWFRGPTSD